MMPKRLPSQYLVYFVALLPWFGHLHQGHIFLVSGASGNKQTSLSHRNTWKYNEESCNVRVPWTMHKASLTVRGGSDFQSSNTAKNSSNNVTVEEYVAAVEERDAKHRTNMSNVKSRFQKQKSPMNGSSSDQAGDSEEEEFSQGPRSKLSQAAGDLSSENTPTDQNQPDNEGAQTTPEEGAAPEEDPNASVGVKSHQHKKSNAVGDPDGDDSDDDTDDSSEDWEDFEEELEELDMDMLHGASSQLQVEMEVVEDDGLDDIEDGEEAESGKTSGGGGVARLGRLSRRKSRKQDWQSSNDQSKKTTTSLENEEIVEAWLPHVYLPPSPDAFAYLVKNSRLIDAASKTRLDRRTLYAGLLLEWLNQSASNRKFLDTQTSQSLQAALSLATQPEWRRSFPRPSAVRLFENEVGKSCTLGMQETITMALAHSLGSAMVILDDDVLMSTRQKLLRQGYASEDVKPSALIRHLLESAREGVLNNRVGGSIAKCMKRDLSLGLDDPYDERAMSSCTDMSTWEEEWHKTPEEKPVPLVLFIRTQSSQSLLKSKSAVDILQKECNSEESVNLVVLGRGINSHTSNLPKDNTQEGIRQLDAMNRDAPPNQLPGAAPWFGFSQQNQNASGQNDPEGSRRFNIFLARTVDANGVPGILGAIAPPQAGNLFPHMMAMQARERMQNEDDNSPMKGELERWSQLLLQQMQQANRNNDSNSVSPPQFFNASLSTPFADGNNPMFPPNAQPPPQEIIQRTLEHALSELLDKLAQMNDDNEPPPTSPSELSPDLHTAFAQVLRNDNIRRGIADNLARAAPALSDPKCQGVMLSVYVPPPPSQLGKMPGQNINGNGGKSQSNNVGNWFRKILDNQEAAETTAGGDKEEDEGQKKKAKQKRARTMAAYSAVLAAKNAQDSKNTSKGDKDNKAERNLAKLEAVCRSIPIKPPADPVRAKSWEGWIARERGAIVFRRNRKALNEELQSHRLSLQQHTGTRGAGSALRQMLSVRDVSEEMDEVIKCAVEVEAAKGQRLHETPEEIHEKEMDLGIDITLSQLLMTDEEELCEIGQTAEDVNEKHNESAHVKYLHPSSLEAALSLTCRVSSSPSGGLSVYSSPASHRSKEEIMSLAQDKHERALVNQVVSPQDIGVTYDMIGGLSEVKELLRQSITYPLKYPHLYSEGIAREAVKGVLLFGPPGTGKTMLAKAVATEGGASFLSVDASSVENKWLGESEKNAKAVFTLARRLAPCVIFIDEVDSLLSSREGTSDDSAHGTLTSVKTTMMSEWDGLNSGTNGNGEAGADRVVVIGSTNRPYDLDEAVLRRFPRRILVDLPDLETRTEILEVTMAENRLGPGVNLTAIAERLEGYTGSDIKEVCREAVVQISHEQAQILDKGLASAGDKREDVTQGSLQRLRPVNTKDFETALSKLKRSVSEKGKELTRVWEWNDEYGEIKKEKKNTLPHLMNMYL